MADRPLLFPSRFLRWLMAPAVLGALLAAVTSLLHRRTRQPSMPRMSDEWLQNLDRGSSEVDAWR